MELEDIIGLGPATEEDLREAGIESPADLLEADLEDLAGRTDIGEGRLQDFTDQARDGLDVDALEDEADDEDDVRDRDAGEDGAGPGTIEPEEPDTAKEQGEEEDEGQEEADDEDEIVIEIQKGAVGATVRVGDDVHQGLSIVTATADEDPTDRLELISEDGVLLPERAGTGYVRLDGVIHEDVPLVQVRENEDGEREEIPVSVHEVHETEESDDSDGLLGKFL